MNQWFVKHVCILFQILFLFRWLQSIEQSSLCSKERPCWLSIVGEVNIYNRKTLSKADRPGVRRVSLVWSVEGCQEQIWGLLEKRKLSLNTMIQKYSWICGLRPSQHQISICQSLPLCEPIPYDKCLILTPQTIACQAPLSMGFSRQEYWGELPCPPPGDRHNPGIAPASPALRAGTP